MLFFSFVHSDFREKAKKVRMRRVDIEVEEVEMQVKEWSSCRGRRCSGIDWSCACKESG